MLDFVCWNQCAAARPPLFDTGDSAQERNRVWADFYGLSTSPHRSWNMRGSVTLV
jgi:hypothetical protein